MNNRSVSDLVTSLLIIISSIFVGLFSLWLFTFFNQTSMNTSSYIYTFLIILLTYSILNLFINNPIVSFTISPVRYLPILILFITSIFVFVIPNTENISYLNWSELSIFNYMRAFGVLYLVFFSPGYLLISLIDEQYELKFPERHILAFFPSVFITTFVGVIGVIYNNMHMASYYIIIVNIFLSILSIYQQKIRNMKKNIINEFNVKFDTSFYSILIFIIIMSICIFIMLLMFFPANLYPGYDVWQYYGDIIRILESPKQVTWIFQYFVIYMFSSIFITLSGLPSLNAYMFLFPLTFLSIPLFYIISKKILSEIQAILSVVIFSIFNGFGWMDVLVQNFNNTIRIAGYIWPSSQFTGDMSLGIQGLSYWFHAQHLGLIFYLALIYLMIIPISKRLRYILISTTFFTGYWLHASEIALFIATLIFFIIFLKSDFPYIHINLLAILIGLIMTSIFFVLPIYLFSNLIFIQLKSHFIMLILMWLLIGGSYVALLIIKLPSKKIKW